MSTPPTFPTVSGPLSLAGPAGVIEAAVELPKEKPASHSASVGRCACSHCATAR